MLYANYTSNKLKINKNGRGKKSLWDLVQCKGLSLRNPDTLKITMKWNNSSIHHQWVGKQNEVYIYTIHYYSAIRRNEVLIYATTWVNLEHRYAKWKKQDTKRQIYDFTYMKYLEYVNSQRHKVD